MKKRNMTSLHRTAGIIAGLALSAVILFTSFVRVLYNRDYYLTQDVRYGIINQTQLKNTDEYAKIYRGMINALKGQQLNVYPVQFVGDETEYCSLYSDTGKIVTAKESQYCEYTFSVPEKFVHTVESIRDYTNSGSWFEIAVALPNTADYNARVRYAVENISVTAVLENGEKSASGNVTYTEAGGVSAEDFSGGEIQQGKGGAIKIYIDYELFKKPEIIKEIKVSFDISSKDGITVGTAFKIFGGKTAEDCARTVGGDWADAFTKEETEKLNSAGKAIKTVGICITVFAVLALAFCIYVIVKEKRKCLYGIGVYICVVAVLVLIAVNVVTRVLPTEVFTGYLTSDTNGGLFLPHIITDNFARDYYDGVRRFFDFLTLIPLFTGYAIISLSKKKKDEPDGEYLYQ